MSQEQYLRDTCTRVAAGVSLLRSRENMTNLLSVVATLLQSICNDHRLPVKRAVFAVKSVSKLAELNGTIRTWGPTK